MAVKRTHRLSYEDRHCTCSTASAKCSCSRSQKSRTTNYASSSLSKNYSLLRRDNVHIFNKGHCFFFIQCRPRIFRKFHFPALFRYFYPEFEPTPPLPSPPIRVPPILCGLIFAGANFSEPFLMRKNTEIKPLKHIVTVFSSTFLRYFNL